MLHFPKGEKYVSVLKDSENPQVQAVIAAERARLRAIVHRQLADIAMVTEADEGAALVARQHRAARQEAALRGVVRNPSCMLRVPRADVPGVLRWAWEQGLCGSILYWK